MWKINKRLFLWDTPCKCLYWAGRAQPAFGSQSLDLRLQCWQLSGTHMLFAAPPSWAMTRRPLPCAPPSCLCAVIKTCLAGRATMTLLFRNVPNFFSWNSFQSKNKERMRKWGFGSRLVCARIYSLLAVLHCWLLNGTPLLCMLSSTTTPFWGQPL